MTKRPTKPKPPPVPESKAGGGDHYRFVVYIPKDEYRRFKAQLAILGTSVSEWVRQKIRNVINDGR